MKFKKVTHYVENSYDHNPSFKIEMSDGKTYLSNDSEFLEDTTQNRQYLIDRYDCQSYLDELDNSPIDNHDSITNASYMMCGCEELTEFELTAINLEKSRCMLLMCGNVVNFKLEAPSLKYACLMLWRGEKLKEIKIIAPNLIQCDNMLLGSNNIENFELEAPPHIMEKYKHLLNKR